MTCGQIHLYCGDGKGKTTAAIGLLVRALGNGKRCVLVQFLKGGESGEIAFLQGCPNLTVYRGKQGTSFFSKMSPEEKEETKKLHMENLEKAINLVETGKCDLLVLDEVCAAFRYGLVEEQTLRSLVQHKPETLELVLTGRNPAEFMVEAADYLTEMQLKKHPFQKGIGARKGIEF